MMTRFCDIKANDAHNWNHRALRELDLRLTSLTMERKKKTKTEHQNVPSVTCSSQIADWSWRDATLKSINTTTFLSKIECLKVIFLLKLLNRLHLQNDDATLNIEFIRTLLY